MDREVVSLTSVYPVVKVPGAQRLSNTAAVQLKKHSHDTNGALRSLLSELTLCQESVAWFTDAGTLHKKAY